MIVEQSAILSLFASIESLENDKKGISDEIKETFETFALNNEINKKAVMKAFKEWKAWKKDQAEYTEIDYESSELFVKAVPEMGTDAN